MKFDYDRYIVLFLSFIVIVLTVGISLVVSFFYVLTIARNSKYPVSTATNVLLVLGKKLDNNSPDDEYNHRLNRAAQVLKNNLACSVYILGGVTSSASIAESEAGKKVLLDLEIDNNRIFLEKDSVHTLENLKNFYCLSNDKSQKVLLITNRYHLARSRMMANGFKINTLSCPAENSFKYTPTNIGKIMIEAFYINFYLSGKYWAMLTNNGKIINRISTP
ncbi:GdmH [uncultured Candidatus Thioglobus sp.]|nr:GdmH [uncultured Candidatus Thioglobus sp.]